MSSTSVVYNLIARDHASQTFDDVGRKTGHLSSAISKMGVVAKRAAQVTGVVLAAGVYKVGKETFSAASSFETAQKTLTGLYGSARDANDIMARLKKTAGKSPIDYDTFTKGAEQLAYMGIKGKQANDILGNISDAVVAIGGGSEEMNRATDAMLKMVNAGQVNLDTLNQLSEAGVPIFSGLAAHYNTNIKHVRKMVTAGKIGIDDVMDTVQKAQGKTFKSMQRASRATSKTFSNQFKIASDRVRTALGSAAAPLLSKMTPALTKVGKYLSDTLIPNAQQFTQTLFGGKVQRQADPSKAVKMADVSRKKWEALKNKGWKGNPTDQMEALYPPGTVTKAQKMGKKLHDALQPAIDAANAFWKGLAGGEAFGSGTLVDIENFGGDVRDAFINGFSNVKDRISGVLGGVSFSEVVKDFADHGKALANHVIAGVKSGIKTGNWGPLGKTIGESIGDHIKTIAGLGNKLSNALVTAIGNIDWVAVGGKVGGGAIGFAIGFMSHLGDDLFTVKFWKKHWLDAIVATVSVLPIGKVGGAVGKLLAKIPWGKIIGGVAKLIGRVPLLGPFIRAVGREAGRIGGTIGRFFGRISTSVQNWLTSGAPKIATDIAQWFANLPRRIGGSLTRAAAGMWNRFQNGISKRFGRVRGFLLRFFTRFTLYKAGINLITGLLNGAWSRAKGIAHWFNRKVWTPLWNGVKLYFGIHSPSKKFLSIGKDLIRGLLKGVAALAKRPIKALTTLGRKAVSVFKGSGHWLLSHGKSLVTGMKNGIHQFRKHPVDSLTRMGKAEVSVFSKAVSWLIPGGHQLVSGMKKGIRDFRQHPIDTLTSLGKSMRRVFTNAPDWLVHHGKQLISGLKSGINTAMDGIKKWLRHHVWGPITNGVKSLFGIHSPSSVFAGFGHNMIRGLIKGLIKSDPRAFVKKIFGGVSDSAVQALGWMVNHGQVALDKLGNLSSSVLSKLGGIGGAAVGKLKGLFGGGGGGGDTGSYSGVALQVLRMFGYGREWLPRLLHRMNVESGGNPGIVNKWDSNWQAGHPSVGLMQVIRGTFDAFAGPFRNLGPFKYGVSTNPLANIYAAVNYALSRYGVPAVGGTQGYDKGGWLPTGTSLVHNHTGRSEPTAVFTRTQWETLHALASGGSGGNFPRRLVLVTGQGQEFEAYMDDRVDLQLGQVTRAMAAG